MIFYFQYQSSPIFFVNIEYEKGSHPLIYWFLTNHQYLVTHLKASASEARGTFFGIEDCNQAVTTSLEALFLALFTAVMRSMGIRGIMPKLEG